MVNSTSTLATIAPNQLAQVLPSIPAGQQQAFLAAIDQAASRPATSSQTLQAIQQLGATGLIPRNTAQQIQGYGALLQSVVQQSLPTVSPQTESQRTQL